MSADLEAEPVDVLVGAGMRPGGRRDRAGDDHRGAGDDADERDEPQPAWRDRRAEPARVAPRLERDDDRERDDDEREQEVGHHGERVQVEDHREAAERDLGDRAEERRERRPLRTHARSPCDAGARRARSTSASRMPPSATTRLPNSTIAWKSFAGKGVAAPRPVVAAEPRAGEPDERRRT